MGKKAILRKKSAGRKSGRDFPPMKNPVDSAPVPGYNDGELIYLSGMAFAIPVTGQRR